MIHSFLRNYSHLSSSMLVFVSKQKSINWGLRAGRSTHSITHSHPVHFIALQNLTHHSNGAVIHGLGGRGGGEGETFKWQTSKRTKTKTSKQVMSHVTTPLTLRNVLQDYASTCATTPPSHQKAVTTFGR